MSLRIIGLGAAGLIAAALAFPAWAQDPHAAQGPTANMQGDASAWIADPHTHAFYDLTKQAFAAGPDHVDAAAYQARAYAIFDDFGRAMHWPAGAMVDHLKLIPGQVVQIVKEDPHVLDSYDNFIAAVFGPQ